MLNDKEEDYETDHDRGIAVDDNLTCSQVKDEEAKQRWEQEVMKAEEEWRAAVAKGDGTVLKRLIADDIVTTGVSCQIKR